MAEKIKHRSRMGGQPSGRTLHRQDRDVDTCAALQEFPLLPSHYLPHVLGIPDSHGYRQRRFALKNDPFPVPDKNGVVSRRAPVLYVPELMKTRDEWHTKGVVGLSHTGYRLLHSEGRAHRLYITNGEHDLHCLHRSTVGASLKIAIRDAGWEWFTKDQILDHEKCPPETASSMRPLTLTLPDGRRLSMDDLYRWRDPSMVFHTYFHEADQGNEDTWTYGKKHSSLEEKVVRYDILFEKRLYEAHFGIKGKPDVLITTIYEKDIPGILEMIEATSRFPDRYLLHSAPYFDPTTWTVPPLMLDLFTHPWRSVKGPVFLNR